MSFQRARISCTRCATLAHMLLQGDSATSVKKYVGKGLIEATEKATATDLKLCDARYKALEALELVLYHPASSEAERSLATRCLDACATCDHNQAAIANVLAPPEREAPSSGLNAAMF